MSSGAETRERVRTGWLPRLLLVEPAELWLEGGVLHHRAPSASGQVAAHALAAIEVRRGLLHATLRCRRHDGSTLSWKGLPGEGALRLQARLELARYREATESAVQAFEFPDGRDQYLTKPLLEKWRSDHAELHRHVVGWLRALPNVLDQPEAARRLADLFAQDDEGRRARNDAWVARQREKHHELLNARLGYRLNEEQVEAVLRDEHRSLVVAGAGTGKTSTIVAKVAWILEQGLAEPDEIVVLAFNRRAAEEVGERIEKAAGRRPRVSTFHALGLHIIGLATGAKPHVSELATDERKLWQFLRGGIAEGLKSSAQGHVFLEFLSSFRFPTLKPVPVEGSHAQFQTARGLSQRDLTGTLVKSGAEVAIANWLTLHGIKWRYEAAYCHRTATPHFSQYRPDFYLPDHEIYIEHWACDKGTGAAPSEWPRQAQQKYVDRMKWARAIHAKHGTRLVEVYSTPGGRRAMLLDLERALQANKVVLKPLVSDELEELLGQKPVQREVDDLTKLVRSFLRLLREGAVSVDQLHALASSNRDERAVAFLAGFKVILSRYEAELAASGEVDFSQMIHDAVASLHHGRATLRARYLIVDEFQDISSGRASLLKEILAANPGCRFLAVGDDWQSINRFAGGDVGVMVKFGAHFGEHLRLALRKTNRFGSGLLNVSSMFIQQNPLQLKKELEPAFQKAGPAIEVLGMPSRPGSAGLGGAGLVADGVANIGPGSAAELVLDAYDKASADCAGCASALVLGRYGFLEEVLQLAKKQRPGANMNFSTVHKAKGAEADYVIILDVIAARLGFPSGISDDPLLRLVMAAEDGFAHAEERRLFYVALTRARRKVFVLTDNRKCSVFVDELDSEPYRDWVASSGVDADAVPCPECEGRVVLRSGDGGQFYGCENYPLCRFTYAGCPKCSRGGVRRNGGKHECMLCGHELETCPRCRQGYLILKPTGTSKKGEPYPAFWGCSTYHAANLTPCKFTKPA